MRSRGSFQVRWWSAVAFGALFFALVAAGDVSGATPGTLVVRVGTDISVLDPAKIFQRENQTVAQNIYNGLVRYDLKTNRIEPDLATEWSVGEGGRAYTFRLRSGVKWHKGYGEFTADDVKFSIERVLDPATRSLYAGEFGNVSRVVVVDPTRVRVELKKASGTFLNKVAAFNQGWIVSRKAVTALGDKYTLNPIGTGPFVFERYESGNAVYLQANKDYFEGVPGVAKLVFKIIKQENVAAIALETGEIDILDQLASADANLRLRNTPEITVAGRESNGTVNLVLNITVPPLNDVRVRQAIAYAIDRDALNREFFKGTRAPAFSILTTTFPEFTKEVPQYPFNPAQAKRLIAEAGAAGAALELSTFNLPPYDQLFVVLAQYLQNVGLNAKIRVLERSAYLQARTKGELAACLTGVVGPPDAAGPIRALYSTSSFPPGLNTSRYDRIDDLLNQAEVELDAEKRTELFRGILRRAMTDVPVIPLYTDVYYLAYRTKRVRGLIQNSLGSLSIYPITLAD